MGIFLQVVLVALALMGVAAVYGEVRCIFHKDVTGGRVYLLCIPDEGMTEGFCRGIMEGRGCRDIIISGNLSPEDEKIGRLLESAERNVYFIKPKDLPVVADPNIKINCP